MKSLDSVEVFGLRINKLFQADLLAYIRNALQSEEHLSVGYANIYAMNIAWEQTLFRDTINSFDIVFCDGIGLKLGAALVGLKIPERYTPPDFIHLVMELVQEQEGSVFLLGAEPHVAERAAHILLQHTQGLIISGKEHGYFNKSYHHPENKALVSRINEAHPSALLVGFGMPLQEEWVVQNRMDLDVPVIMTVGALFDTLAGDIVRAPRWVTDHGFEWLARLITEPSRLWRRYLVGNPLFFLRLVYWRIFKKH